MSILVKFDDYQTQQIADALNDLFVLQDRPCTEGKKALLIRELEGYGYPYKAIIQGIKSLHSDDLKSIKLVTLKNAIIKFISPELRNNGCKLCNGSGSVLFMDSDGKRFALACTCSEGYETQRAQELVRWNGQKTMLSKNRQIFHVVNNENKV